ncbi:MAG TPA: outer membrane protein transport protein [Acetobacteraceae bacterium]|nr:outer membrane protein transport protein [Acetobacteraceae bacterium]
MPLTTLFPCRPAHAALLLVAPLLALLPTAAHSAGFQLRTGSPDWSANAFAGMAAKGYDAGTAWTNPAGMTLLDRSEIDTGLNAIFPSARFSGQDLIGPVPVPGSQGGNAAEFGLTPSLEGVWSYAPRLKFGLAVEAPFGLRTTYPADFVGRYQANVSSVSDIEIGLSAAFRINQHLSLGAGPIFDAFQTRLTNAINIGPVSALTGDPAIDIHGSDWALGYHLGVLYEINPHVRLGLDYRSRINHQLSGAQSIFVPPLLARASPATAALLAARNTSATAKATLPDILTLSYYADLSEEWSLMATAQWTHWSLLQQVTVVGANGQTESLALKFRSTWFASVGANYHPRWAPRLTLQAGTGFDRSPVDNTTRSPRIPARAGVPLGVGLTYAVLPNTSLQLAYLHEFYVRESGVDFSSTPSAGRIIGSYASHADVVSVGAKMMF